MVTSGVIPIWAPMNVESPMDGPKCIHIHAAASAAEEASANQTLWLFGGNLQPNSRAANVGMTFDPPKASIISSFYHIVCMS